MAGDSLLTHRSATEADFLEKRAIFESFSVSSGNVVEITVFFTYALHPIFIKY